MYLDRAMAGTKHLWSDNRESDIAEYTVNVFHKYLIFFFRMKASASTSQLTAGEIHGEVLRRAGQHIDANVINHLPQRYDAKRMINRTKKKANNVQRQVSDIHYFKHRLN